jgi:hypothetical protein
VFGVKKDLVRDAVPDPDSTGLLIEHDIVLGPL